MRIMTVYGTRPEAIKLAPVLRALTTDQRFETLTVVTGQHREMLNQVNTVFEISPDCNLDVFETGQSLNLLLARALQGLDPMLERRRPDVLLVQGDTTTALAATLAAFQRQVPIVHLEAGLRSSDLAAPFPEEGNRRIITQLADLHLAPTLSSKMNLLKESVPADSIVVTGNTVIDALRWAALEPTEVTSDEMLAAALRTEHPILLVTAHRRENWPRLAGVGAGLAQIAAQHPELTIVLPAHRNPLVRDAILPQLIGYPNVIATEPLPYGEFIQVMKAARIVLTDSGGIQEEAPALGKPVLVLRDKTERCEAVTAGTVRVIGTEPHRIAAEVNHLIEDADDYAAMASAVNLYGDGHAADRAVAALAAMFGIGERLPDFGSDEPKTEH